MTGPTLRPGYYQDGDWGNTIYLESPYYLRDRPQYPISLMDPLSDVLSLLKPRTYMA
ncbi:MAG: hypothetical protein QOJ42_100, partial [Acidobacteriaceae bacterium]|nr:hypothetical protein [Acidobacteriaceae bacterium]